MALRRDLTYPARYDAATPNQPQGAFKNRSAPAVLDGSYLEEGWLNDWSGFFGKLLGRAGITPNNTVDTALDSQYMDAAEIAFYNRVGRNIIMNGDFAVSQRGTAFAPVTNVDWTIDRWAWSEVPAGGVISGNTVTQVPFDLGQVDVPNNPINYMSASGSIAGGNGNEALAVLTMIEDVSLLAGEDCVLSYWVKGTVAGQFYQAMYQFFGFGIGPSTPELAFADMIPITTDWTKITIPISMPSIAGKTIDEIQNFIQIQNTWNMGAANAAGSPNAVANAYGGILSFSDFQLEKGTVATEYERLEIGRQRAMCMRFCQFFSFGTFGHVGTYTWNGGALDTCDCTWNLTTQMRITPTCRTITAVGNLTNRGSGTIFLPIAGIGIGANKDKVVFNIQPRTDEGTGDSASMEVQAGATWVFEFDAEMVVNG